MRTYLLIQDPLIRERLASDMRFLRRYRDLYRRVTREHQHKSGREIAERLASVFCEKIETYRDVLRVVGVAKRKQKGKKG